jgi:hypothetical protein
MRRGRGALRWMDEGTGEGMGRAEGNVLLVQTAVSIITAYHPCTFLATTVNNVE